MSALDSGEVWVYNDYVETGRGVFVSSPETHKPHIFGRSAPVIAREKSRDRLDNGAIQAHCV